MNGPGPEHAQDSLQEDHEHGEDWITCKACGGQWNKATGEQVSEGDGWCWDLENSK